MCRMVHIVPPGTHCLHEKKRRKIISCLLMPPFPSLQDPKILQTLMSLELILKVFLAKTLPNSETVSPEIYSFRY